MANKQYAMYAIPVILVAGYFCYNYVTKIMRAKRLMGRR